MNREILNGAETTFPIKLDVFRVDVARNLSMGGKGMHEPQILFINLRSIYLRIYLTDNPRAVNFY
jgi:hypothetical protein